MKVIPETQKVGVGLYFSSIPIACFGCTFISRCS